MDTGVTIRRDRFGVAHVKGADERDLWFGQGFASAQDRLWQMEYDRRRAAGRWAEVAGPGAVAADVLARRLQLVRASQADVEAMSPPTRAMFEAYAAGVNAFLESGRPLPPEYELSGIEPEPWQPWHSVAAFKVRHVLMGVWQQKLARAQLLAMIGPQAYARLDGRPPVGSPTILPPGGKVGRLFAESFDELRRAASHLGFLAEAEGGSNSWAVHGSRTTTGKPVLCNDSHRALDVPNVYWQVHLTCPDFDAIGATFPGFPGLPHFGHNGHVGWSITHTGADYQDLYVERFSGPAGSASPVVNASDPADPGGAGQHPGRHPIRSLTPQGWEEAERVVERIEVAGASALDVEVWRTRHGPVVHGDPRRGLALALRYTATDGPCRGFEVLRPMLRARTVAELQETQRSWVDPVNNLVAADSAGSIGYLTRGTIPIRSSTAHRQFPAPGWTGEHEWVGYVPFESLPRVIDPPQGFIATANQAVIAEDEPYIAHEFSPPFRAARIVELLSAEGRLAPDEIAAIQGDTTSRAARAWVRRLARSGPYDGQAEAARAMLAAWDGNLLPESGVALLYGAFRRAVARALFVPIVGERAWSWLTAPDVPATHTLIARWMVNVVYALEAETTPDGRPWDEVLPDALATAWSTTVAGAGPDPQAWRWDAQHATRARHPLAARFPAHAARLNPPRVPLGGDGDTIQAAAYLWGEGDDFAITGLSVYRQVVDLADVAHSSFVIPGGVSGVPGSAHFDDQLEHWRTHRRIPMHVREAEVEAATVETLSLPASASERGG